MAKKTKLMLKVEERLGEDLGDYLRREYTEKKRSSPQIAQELGIGYATVTRFMKVEGISLRNRYDARLAQTERGMAKRREIRELEERLGEDLEVYLKREYANKSILRISKELDISEGSIRKRLEKMGMHIKNLQEAALPVDFVGPTEKELRKCYTEDRTPIYKIAKKFKVSWAVIKNLINKYNIKKITTYEFKLPPNFIEPTRDQLCQWYNEKRMHPHQIAEMLEISTSTVNRLLKKHEIKTRNIQEAILPLDFVVPTKEQLYQWYIKEKKSAIEIGKAIGVSSCWVYNKLKKYNIPTRDVSEALLPTNIKKPSKKELYDLYWKKGMNTYQIAKEFGVADGTVGNWLRKDKIRIRTNSESQLPVNFVTPTKEELYNLYWSMGEAVPAIAKRLGIGVSATANLLNRNKIPMRNTSESMLLKKGIKKPAKETLEEMYNKKGMSIRDMAREIGVNHITIKNWLEDYKIINENIDNSKYRLESMLNNYAENG